VNSQRSRQSADNAACREHVVSDGDFRTPGDLRHESGRVDGTLQKVAHLRSTFGERLSGRVHYSRVRDVHVDRRYGALHTATVLLNSHHPTQRDKTVLSSLVEQCELGIIVIILVRSGV